MKNNKNTRRVSGQGLSTEEQDEAAFLYGEPAREGDREGNGAVGRRRPTAATDKWGGSKDEELQEQREVSG